MQTAGGAAHVVIWTVLGLALAGILMFLAFLSLRAHQSVFDDVNRRLPTSEQFSPYWWHPVKYLRFWAAYRRLYPGGKKLLRWRLLDGLTQLYFLAVVLGLYYLFVLRQ